MMASDNFTKLVTFSELKRIIRGVNGKNYKGRHKGSHSITRGPKLAQHVPMYVSYKLRDFLPLN